VQKEFDCQTVRSHKRKPDALRHRLNTLQSKGKERQKMKSGLSQMQQNEEFEVISLKAARWMLYIDRTEEHGKT
jgi:hypothetical protein